MAKTHPYRIERLDKHHNRKNFSCGEVALDRYFKEQARQDATKKLTATFVLIDNVTDEIVGFYSLTASAIDAGEFPARLRISKYSTYPVILLGKLATSIQHREKEVRNNDWVNSYFWMHCLGVTNKLAKWGQ